MRLFRFSVSLLLAGAALTAVGEAQTPSNQAEKRWEVGTQFTGLRVNTLNEGAAGWGGRVSYDLFRKNRFVIAPEVEFNDFPQNPSGNFGEVQLLAGTRAGLRTEDIGVFLKVRPGYVHVGGNDFKLRNGGAADCFSTDIGGVFEYYGSHNVGVRVDWGDTMIVFPKNIQTGLLQPVPGGLSHNLQGGIGIVFRF
jgi:hypothetical protein